MNRWDGRRGRSHFHLDQLQPYPVWEATYRPYGEEHPDASGQPTVNSTHFYNNRLQPCRIHVRTSGSAPTACGDTTTAVGNVLDFKYSFDSDPGAGVMNNGNVVQLENRRDVNRTQNFTYDELNRIRTATTQATSGTHAWGLTFGYDVWANLLSATVTQGSAPQLSLGASLTNRIAGYCYDAAGNLLIEAPCGGTATYTYDAENRITTTAGVTYTYDGDGKRVKKSNGKLYWTGTGSDALAESDLSGNISDEYIFFNGKRIARRIVSSGAVHYYFADHLGSSRIVTNASGGILEDSDFYPFGGERVVVDSADNRYKFTGKERDAESGNDYYGARYYSSLSGRFLSPDEFTGGPVDAFSASDPLPPGPLPYAQITNPQSLNKYAYTYNNPLRFIDPDGHDVLDFFMGVGNAVKSNLIGGGGRETSYNQDHAVGQSVGDALSVVGGFIEMAHGAMAAAGGVVLSGTGAGALVGVPTVAAGAAVGLHGVVTASTGLSNLLKENTGEIYVTEPQESGKPYVGRTTQGTDKRMATRTDGRTGKAKAVDTYDPKNPQQGRYKEQKQMDKRGGKQNLDNKRNEVAPKKMKKLKEKFENQEE